MVTAHAGDNGMSSYQGDLPVENASAMVAEEVPGIDAVLFGHAHNEVPEKFVTNKVTGEQVLLTEPGKWGQRLSVVDFTLTESRGRWTGDRQVVDDAEHQHRAGGPEDRRADGARSTTRRWTT